MKMKVLFFTEGTSTSPASRIRVYEYLNRFSTSWNLSPRYISFTSESYCRRLVAGEEIPIWRKLIEQFYKVYAITLLFLSSIFVDIVFIQRILLPIPVQFILKILNRKQVVYDFDDAIYTIGKSPRGDAKRVKRFSFQVKNAARIIAVSNYGAKKAIEYGAKKDKVAVVRSSVDTNYFRHIKKRDYKIFTVGWIGLPDTTKYLESIWPQLAEFAKTRTNVQFVFIGAKTFPIGTLKERTTFINWSPQSEAEILTILDVGLMPLTDDEWSRGKGSYKLIQYMAAGVACLASPVGANKEILEHGRTGYFIQDDNDWSVRLAQLMEDRSLCHELGREGAKKAKQLYDYTVSAPVILSQLEKAKKAKQLYDYTVSAPVILSQLEKAMIELNWRKVITDSEEIRIFEALEDPSWDWRTIKALSRESGLKLDQVHLVIASYPHLIRRSEILSESGEDLYTLHSRYYDRKNLLEKWWDFLSSSSTSM